MDPEMKARSENIVIIGGGIIGCSTAYFLSRHPLFDLTRHKITLIEASRVAGGASGKAGGLLALWAYPSSIVPLSYHLHASLAKEHGGASRWGYRQVHCGQLAAVGRHINDRERKRESETSTSVSLQKRKTIAADRLRAAGIPRDLDWFLPENVRGYDVMGGPDTTAQVHPFQFTTAMAELAQEKGVQIRLGAVSKINYDEKTVRSVDYIDKATGEARVLLASTVIVAAGPWTRTIYPSAPISALRAHSVTVRPSRPVSAYAIFTEIALPPTSGSRENDKQSKPKRTIKKVTPEIYARPNNEVYACGEGDTLVPIPSTSDLVRVDEKRCQDIIDHVSSISDELRDGEVLVRQACYLPNVEGPINGPLIGKTDINGLFLAAGHTCWGIQNGPATGKLISELVFDGKTSSADIASLDPRQVL